MSHVFGQFLYLFLDIIIAYQNGRQIVKIYVDSMCFYKQNPYICDTPAVIPYFNIP